MDRRAFLLVSGVVQTGDRPPYYCIPTLSRASPGRRPSRPCSQATMRPCSHAAMRTCAAMRPYNGISARASCLMQLVLVQNIMTTHSLSTYKGCRKCNHVGNRGHVGKMGVGKKLYLKTILVSKNCTIKPPSEMTLQIKHLCCY